MEIGGTPIRDAHAEAFPMWAARLCITALGPEWAFSAARSATGFATSIIGCDCEAGLERTLAPEETPDGRPGVSILLFTRDREDLGDVLLRRIGQSILTCATAACFDGFPDASERTPAGRRVSLFGDGHERREEADGRTLWRIPVTEGIFTTEESFGLRPGLGGGNFLVLGGSPEAALEAAVAAAAAMRDRPGVILPFPAGVSRAASKVGARRHPSLRASTNDRYVPGLPPESGSALPEEARSVLELVVDGVDEEAVRSAMRAGIIAACRPGVAAIDAAEFGGRLGSVKLPLREIVEESGATPEA